MGLKCSGPQLSGSCLGFHGWMRQTFREKLFIYLSWINDPWLSHIPKYSDDRFSDYLRRNAGFSEKLLSCDINIPTPGTDILLEKRSQERKQRVLSSLWMRTTLTMEALNVIRDLSHHGRQPLSIVLKGRWRCWDAVGAGFLLTPRTHHFLMIKQIPSGQSLHRICLGAFFITEGSQMCARKYTPPRSSKSAAGRTWCISTPGPHPQWDNP